MNAEKPSARLAVLIKHHFGPGAGVPLKALARAAGKTEETIRNYADAATAPSVDTAEDIIRALIKAGCADAYERVFGRPVAPAGGGDACLIITDDGAVNPAPHGPGLFVRQSIGVRHDVGFDAPSYAFRMLGWVEISIRADGRLIVRRGCDPSPEASARAAAWLATQARAFAAIEVHTLQGDDWSVRTYGTLRAAAAAFEAGLGARSVADQLSTSIVTQRLAEDLIGDPLQAAMRRASCGRVAPLEPLLSELHALPGQERASLLRRTADGWMVLSAGPATRLRRDLAGMHLRQMRDQRFADVAEAQLDAMAEAGMPRFDDFQIRTISDSGAYRRFALPARGADGGLYAVCVADIYRHPQGAALQ
jgi:hypothetical protein